MTIESDALREALFAQMSAPPLPEYSGDTVILRGRIADPISWNASDVLKAIHQ